MKLPNPINLTDVTRRSFSFETLETLQSFIKTECTFWERAHSSFPEKRTAHSYTSSFNNFKSAFVMIESWKPNLKIWREDEFNAQLATLWNNYLKHLPNNWLWSGHAYVVPWLESYKFSQATGEGFIEAVVSKKTSQIGHYEWLQGYLLAYEFLLQDESQLTKRRNAEKATYRSIRDQLSIKKDELINEVQLFQDDITTWKNKTQAEIKSWHTNQVKLVDDTAILHSNSFQARISAWTEKISELENTYKEKLRLNGPATYWQKSAKKFRAQGFYWAALLVITCVAGLIGFGDFYIAWLQGQATPLKLQTLQGIILFAAILAAFAFLVRSLSRLTFSSFHLQRDAEEREQLTYLYLALSKDTTVDDESRQIILQALFSRSETGLLAKESTPAMPGVHDVISVAARSRQV